MKGFKRIMRLNQGSYKKSLIYMVKNFKVNENAWKIVRMILLVGLAFMVVYPMFFRFVVSIKSIADNADPTVLFIPKNPTFFNYVTVFRAIDYPRVFTYTVLFTMMTSLLQMASCMIVAYGLARFKFWGSKIIFACVLATMIIPPQTIILPLSLQFQYFNLMNLFKFTGGINGIDLTGTALPFIMLSVTAMAFKNGLFVFLLRQYYKNLPVALEEAAYIDGCGPMKTFYKIMLPGSVPILVAVFLFSFVWQWNDTIYSASLGSKLPLLTNKLLGLNFITLGTAADIYNATLQTPKFFLLVAPLVLLYIFTQKFFTESIERSGITG
jgi:multiple sugar transport system permease protein